ncbi:efflux RND transporter permease subunit [Halopseudomonas pachastrellae]|nr:efflux RND transporter permease subunit [Halopseudomonas pachastrellae]
MLANASISQVNFAGWLDPMMAIEIDEARLQAYGLTLSDVQQAINANSSSTATAVLRNDRMYLQLKASEQAYLKEDFAALPLISSSDGRHLQLGDVAQIRDTYDDTSASLSRFAGMTALACRSSAPARMTSSTPSARPARSSPSGMPTASCRKVWSWPPGKTAARTSPTASNC